MKKVIWGRGLSPDNGDRSASTKGGGAVDIPNIRLRAEIVIEFDAADFLEAASHQNRLAQVVAELKKDYPSAKLAIRERRNRGPKEVELRPTSRPTGNLRRYSQ